MQRTKQLQGLRKFEDGRAHRGVSSQAEAVLGVSERTFRGLGLAGKRRIRGVFRDRGLLRREARPSLSAPAPARSATAPGSYPATAKRWRRAAIARPHLDRGRKRMSPPGMPPQPFRSWILSLKFAVYV